MRKNLQRTVAYLLCLLLFSTIGLCALTAVAAEVPSKPAASPLMLESTPRAGGGFSYYVLLEDHEIIAELPVKLSRQSDTVSIVPARDLACYLSGNVNVERDVKFVYTWDVKELRAPVKLAQKVGTVQAYLGDNLLDETDLVTNYTVSKSLLSELFEYMKYILLHPVTLLLLAAVIAYSIARLLRSARMASAIKAGKFVQEDDDEPQAEQKENTESSP